MNEVVIREDQREIPIAQERLRKVSETILSVLGCSGVELSILLTDDPTIAVLKEQYFGVREVTDVLAFPMNDETWAQEHRARLLGDVVISVPYAARRAVAAGCSVDVVVDLLLVHGVLHLLGYDHATREEARIMDERTLETLGALGYERSLVEWYLTEPLVTLDD